MVSEDQEPQDELYEQAVQIVLEAKQASVSLLQRRMRVGYTRAARLIDAMEARSVIGPYEGSKPREVLMSLEQYQHNRISS
ncbi:DNA translocase SpoIIIE [compost metagenome]